MIQKYIEVISPVVVFYSICWCIFIYTFCLFPAAELFDALWMGKWYWVWSYLWLLTLNFMEM